MMNTNLRLFTAIFSAFIIGLGIGIITDIPAALSGETQQEEEVLQPENGPPAPPAENEERVIRMRQQMQKHLGLDDRQAEDLFELIRENRTERRRMIQDSRSEFRQSLDEHNEAFRAKLNEILDDEQMAAWDSLYVRDRHQQGGRQRMRSRR